MAPNRRGEFSAERWALPPPQTLASRWRRYQGASLLTLLVPCRLGKDLAGGVNVFILLGFRARRAGPGLGKGRQSGTGARSVSPGLAGRPISAWKGCSPRVVSQGFPTQVG